MTINFLKAIGVFVCIVAGLVTLLVLAYMSYIFVVVSVIGGSIYLIYMLLRAINSP